MLRVKIFSYNRKLVPKNDIRYELTDQTKRAQAHWIERLDLILLKDYVAAICPLTISTLSTARATFSATKKAVATAATIATATSLFRYTAIATIASLTYGM